LRARGSRSGGLFPLDVSLQPADHQLHEVEAQTWILVASLNIMSSVMVYSSQSVSQISVCVRFLSGENKPISPITSPLPIAAAFLIFSCFAA